ncbi:chromobox protein, putative [Entamoeba dispar SAW760]|uniref:Chromobox protein, putative n=1 Tax=Entamoeba dispar (strain ATCC PRA-260 / SAW760) TaxID=370354 RepID=B0E6S8_ENTDS|nr:chromobox protein, putative [Entamoeba dispar SAW760]EDR29759.1 chromobox protein, putative [Entamoeba dispar SAW760]|eukprot:EDR29759.1 chromobox protein, putative [Entamoeba dispar SAW760]
MKLNLKVLNGNGDAIEIEMNDKRTVRFLKDYLDSNQLFEDQFITFQWELFDTDLNPIDYFQKEVKTFGNEFSNEAAQYLDDLYKKILFSVIPIERIQTHQSLIICGVEFFMVDKNKIINSKFKDESFQISHDSTLCIVNSCRRGIGFNLKIKVDNQEYGVEPYTVQLISVSPSSIITLQFQPLIEWSINNDHHYYPIEAPPQEPNLTIKICSILSQETEMTNIQNQYGIEPSLILSRAIKLFKAVIRNNKVEINTFSLPLQTVYSLIQLKSLYFEGSTEHDKLYWSIIGDSQLNELISVEELNELIVLGKINSSSTIVCSSQEDKEKYVYVSRMLLYHRNIPLNECFVSTTLQLDNEFREESGITYPFVKRNPTKELSVPPTPRTKTTKNNDFESIASSLSFCEKIDQDIKNYKKEHIRKPNTRNHINAFDNFMDRFSENQPTSPIIMEEVPQTFEVERIVRKKIVHGITSYLVKWKNYSSKDNTWETEDEIRTKYSVLIDDFEKNQKKPKKIGTEYKEHGVVHDIWNEKGQLHVLYQPDGRPRNVYPIELLKVRNPEALIEYFETKLYGFDGQNKKEE